ncbi:MAG: LutC/YkgG family protein, partial [Candidatus Binataceae bacterium]
AEVRSALERKPTPAAAHDAAGQASQPLSAAAHRAELTAQFGRELELVGGRFFGMIALSDARDRLMELAVSEKIRSVALGAAVVCDLEALVKPLARNRIDLIRTGPVSNGDRARLRDRIAGCDLAIVEADYAIASTGTFCVIATADRPSSLTILPPINFICVAADRILPNLAEVIAAVGPKNFAAHRVALITGPSRTADIEKMIVIGVHGPKQLYAAAIA